MSPHSPYLPKEEDMEFIEVLGQVDVEVFRKKVFGRDQSLGEWTEEDIEF